MTYGIRTSAPGKVFLSGEYAVLEGAKAVISSVGKRIVALPVRTNITQTALLKAAKKHVSLYLNSRFGRDVGLLPNIEIISSGFSKNRKKYGIGSSAAVSVSACGALFSWAGLDLKTNEDVILKVATDTHLDYQEGKGSGADVATSQYGGTIVFQDRNVLKRIDKGDAVQVFVWSGNSACTVSLVEEIKKLKNNAPIIFNNAMAPLVELANLLALAWDKNTSEEIIHLTGEYGIAMKMLGIAANIPIITPELESIASLARQVGGAAKPSGAGGGDAAVGVFSTKEQAESFSKKCTENGFDILDFQTHVEGLTEEKI